jgi:hypothetical protein
MKTSSVEADHRPKVGLCPMTRNTASRKTFFYSRKKRNHLFCYASHKTGWHPTLGEADPGGLGACPQNPTLIMLVIRVVRIVCKGYMDEEESMACVIVG